MGRVAQTDLMPDFAGRTLDRGRYRLMDSLGTGAYGKVYRALDLSFKTPKPQVFAVKCMNKPSSSSHADQLQQREFAHHKLVSGHPNIVTFHRSFTDGLHVYVVLDLCAGGDLFAAITEKRLFYKKTALIKNAFIQLIDAVEHCHRLGVFHRDIKPENVLCSDDGTQIRLADFGLSTRNVISRDFGCGSSYYMSPECIGRASSKGGFRDYRAPENDIWALGVILTNMITGRNPWRFATLQDDCFLAFQNDSNFLKQVLPISLGVNTILKKIFTSHPSRRITLRELRKSMFQLPACYADEEESLCISPFIEETDSEGKKSQSSVDVEEKYIYASPDPNQVPIEKPAQGCGDSARKSATPEDFVLVKANHSADEVPPSTSSASSGSDSKGPITPATHAVDVDPPVDVPDISSEGLGYPADLVNIRPVQVTKSNVASPKHKSRKPTAILRSAVQRIKNLSKAEASS